MTLPFGLMRDVLSRERPDHLLHLLADVEEPVLYTHARDALHLHPEEFKRALGALEKWGLVQLRVVPKGERPDNRRRVRLELTALGRAVVRLHEEVDASWTRITAEAGIPADSLVPA